VVGVSYVVVLRSLVSAANNEVGRRVFTEVPIFSFGCIQDVHGTLFSGYCEQWFATILGACDLRLLHNVDNGQIKINILLEYAQAYGGVR
jgi:hypothetical protein